MGAPHHPARRQRGSRAQASRAARVRHLLERLDAEEDPQTRKAIEAQLAALDPGWRADLRAEALLEMSRFRSMASPPVDEFVTVAEIARQLRVNPQAVRDWIDRRAAADSSVLTRRATVS